MYGAFSAHYKQAHEYIAYIVPTNAKSLWSGKTTETTDWFHLREQCNTLHPTEKPLELLRDWSLKFSNKGDTILDPFMGSGTTLRAAKDLNRKAIGIEIEEKYCEIAALRLSQEVFPFKEMP